MTTKTDDATLADDECQRARTFFNTVLKNASVNLEGRDRELKAVLVALIASGHILLEGVPGTGKTQLLKDFSEVVGLSFQRVQFVPDLLPTELTGWDNRDGEFVPGPFLRGNEKGLAVLGDEINRGSPKTQAGALEAMGEKQVTIDGVKYPIKGLFIVMAAQNPLESVGVNPLTEAQTDRFAMEYIMKRISRIDLKNARKHNNNGRTELVPVDTDKLIEHIGLRPSVGFELGLEEKMLDVLEGIESNDKVLLGPWERPYFDWARVSQACALLDGDGTVKPEHVLEFAPEVLRHRVIFKKHDHKYGDGPAQVEEIINEALNVLR